MRAQFFEYELHHPCRSRSIDSTVQKKVFKGRDDWMAESPDHPRTVGKSRKRKQKNGMEYPKRDNGGLKSPYVIIHI